MSPSLLAQETQQLCTNIIQHNKGEIRHNGYYLQYYGHTHEHFALIIQFCTSDQHIYKHYYQKYRCTQGFYYNIVYSYNI